MYDPEAVYQDADIEQAEYERESRAFRARQRAGICQHSSVVGIGTDGVAHYPEAEGLTGDQVRCTEGTGGCAEVFENDEDWFAACREAR